MEQTDLALLLAEDLNGNFKLLVTHYQGKIYAFLLRHTGSPTDAEDIAQEAFIQAYYALVKYPAQRIRILAVRPWLYKIALNIYYERLRRRRLSYVSLDTTEESPHYDIKDDPALEPEALLETQEARRELATLLWTLPSQYREVVNLYYFASLSYQEITELLNMPMGTVKSYLHRGIRLLRKNASAPLKSQQKGSTSWTH